MKNNFNAKCQKDVESASETIIYSSNFVNKPDSRIKPKTSLTSIDRQPGDYTLDILAEKKE